MFNGCRKVLRFLLIYGPVRTFYKVAGRSRFRFSLFYPVSFLPLPTVGVIGCGQFAFATVGYFLSRSFLSPFIDCFDVDASKQRSFSCFYGIKNASVSASELISNELVKNVYISSNHASHADYAIMALKERKSVYVEKPIAVTSSQLRLLLDAVDESHSDIYAGYNRPFSSAVKILRGHVASQDFGTEYQPVTLNMFISGHFIPDDHWYRDPSEGTRICGNVGHWLDLAVHILQWEKLADHWVINLSFSNPSSRDDDMSIAMTSEYGDLVVIVLTSRSEPFEGINETINFQKSSIISKIDDFRSMSIWNSSSVYKHSFWPKDVGHRGALLQPFSDVFRRDWGEVVKSTLLMLHIARMVEKNVSSGHFSFSAAIKNCRE